MPLQKNLTFAIHFSLLLAFLCEATLTIHVYNLNHSEKNMLNVLSLTNSYTVFISYVINEMNK